ncbi:RloB family protein [Streptomyces sp. NPDC058280]|uniref:RloB family protein n=1 Tax=Streptomyces sp. NPDC058280 TaxID=3346419 RepID=UPI0036EB1D89
MARTPKPSGRKRPSFESRLDRTVGRRVSRQRLLVVCGAKVTERDYVQGLKSSARNPAVSVRVIEHPKAPSQVVSYAAKVLETAGEEYDETWCVLDVDDFTDIDQAVVIAARRQIEIALSNPCFELWLLLHFTDHHRHAPSYKQLVPYLDKYLPDGYSKTGLDFRRYEDGWPDAVRRAKELALEGKEPEVNPSTGMWRLALAIGAPA